MIGINAASIRLDENTKFVVAILNDIVTSELLKNISTFTELCRKRVTVEELDKYLHKIIPFYLTSSIKMKRHELYRIRINENALPFPTNSDVWYPQSNCVLSEGRFNQCHESMLYISQDIITPFHECNTQIGDSFTLIIYSLNDSYEINTILFDGLSQDVLQKNNNFGLNERGLSNYLAIQNFIKENVSYEVSESSTYRYSISNCIKNFFDRRGNFDAFMYASTKHYNYANIAFKPFVVDKAFISATSNFGEFLGFSNNGNSIRLCITKRSKPIYKSSSPEAYIEYEDCINNLDLVLK